METLIDCLAEKLNYYMGKLNISQHKLSVLSSVPYSTIKSIMQKKTTDVKFSTLIMLSDGLGIHVSEFVSGEKFTASYLDL